MLCLVLSAAAVLMNAAQTLVARGDTLAYPKISDTRGDFTGVLNDFDSLGYSVAGLGDLDGDGVGDLAVGAYEDDDGGRNRGAVWVLFLKADGTVKSHQKISDTEGGFTGMLNDEDRFGHSVAWLGDLDGDGIGDLAVGAVRDDDGGTDRGAVWVLLLNANGTVKSQQKISETEGGFSGTLDDYDYFGSSVAPLGDLDGDGTGDLAVGARNDDDAGTDRGAVWLLLLNADGTVKSHQKISASAGDFGGTLDDYDNFGWSVASLGDFDGDGTGDLAVGAKRDDDGGADRGAVWLLLLNADGTVKSHQKISDSAGGFTGTLDNSDYFGSSVAWLGDLDGDGTGDLAVGADADDDGGGSRGAVWVLFLNADGTAKSHQKISDSEGDFGGTLNDEDYFGFSVAWLGDLDGDGTGDLVAGAIGDDDGGTNRGAVWVLLLNPDGTVNCIPQTGDLNCDCNMNSVDIDPFVLALTDPDGYAAAYPDCDRNLADINGDGSINSLDIDDFVDLLTGGG